MKIVRLSVVLLLGGMLCACPPQARTPKAPPTPPPTYTGPEFFRTTISSVCGLSGYQPTLVSGYGLVVNLNGTGSSDVPPHISQWLRNELSKGGFGRESLGMAHLTPDEVLMSNRTTVVIVEALIPPGATPGATFDAVVTAAPGTQTTSLEGGLLYTTELRINGAASAAPSSRPLARAYGPVFMNPFAKPNPMVLGGRDDDARTGRVLNGVVALEESSLALVLNQPSYTRARQISDRINGRFRQAPADKHPIAMPENDQTIRLHLLARYKHNPQRILDLIGHLYLNPTERFAREQAQILIEELAKPENHPYADMVALTWEGMGKLILPTLRQAYDHADPVVKLAALSAGANLGDTLAAPPALAALANSDDGPTAERATAMLGALLAYNPDHTRIRAMVRNLLDSDDARVRMTAFSALFNAGERSPYIIYRNYPGKFELALVRSDKPMIYVSRQGPPRVVIFDQMLGFNYPLFASMWDNRFMVRGDKDELAVAAYYRPPGSTTGQTQQIAPTVGNLVLLMGNVPNEDDPTPGFNLDYGQIVQALYKLTQSGAVDATLVLQQSDLVQRITNQRIGKTTETRPETVETDNSGT